MSTSFKMFIDEIMELGTWPCNEMRLNARSVETHIPSYD